MSLSNTIPRHPSYKLLNRHLAGGLSTVEVSDRTLCLTIAGRPEEMAVAMLGLFLHWDNGRRPGTITPSYKYDCHDGQREVTTAAGLRCGVRFRACDNP